MPIYISLQLIHLDGTPAIDQRIIVRIDGRNYFGLSNAKGQASILAAGDCGLVKVAGESIYYGPLNGAVLTMPA